MVRRARSLVMLLAAGTTVSGLVLAMGAVPAAGAAAQQFADVGAAPATGGTWGKAIEVPGLGTLNARGDAAIFSASCASAGNCATGGFYTDSSGHTQAFVVGQN